MTTSSVLFCTTEQDIIKNIRTFLSPTAQSLDELQQLAQQTISSDKPLTFKAPIGVPLFDVFPELRNHIPFISLGKFPTPITKCLRAQETFGINNLYIKRDDQSGDKSYGGNKLRKLEFLFADALEYFKDVPLEARTVMTFGCAGSNHALATALYAQKLGLNCVLMLKDEWNSHIVRSNLLYDYATGARMNFAPKDGLRSISALYEMLKHKQEYGIFPYIIPTGGSNAIGVLGFVNAVFELKQQIDAGIMPEPDRIYVAAGDGSGGTHAGLLLGVKAAGLKSKVIGVLVEPADMTKVRAWQRRLISEDNEILSSADPLFPHVTIDDADLILLTDYAGDDYALFTSEGVEAIKKLNQSEGIKLDGIYTGKAFSGLLGDVIKQRAQNEVILFWDTYSSFPFENQIKNIDYHVLPKPFHKFFEQDVQPLDL